MSKNWFNPENWLMKLANLENPYKIIIENGKKLVVKEESEKIAKVKDKEKIGKKASDQPPVYKNWVEMLNFAKDNFRAVHYVLSDEKGNPTTHKWGFVEDVEIDTTPSAAPVQSPRLKSVTFFTTDRERQTIKRADLYNFVVETPVATKIVLQKAEFSKFNEDDKVKYVGPKGYLEYIVRQYPESQRPVGTKGYLEHLVKLYPELQKAGPETKLELDRIIKILEGDTRQYIRVLFDLKNLLEKKEQLTDEAKEELERLKEKRDELKDQLEVALEGAEASDIISKLKDDIEKLLNQINKGIDQEKIDLQVGEVFNQYKGLRPSKESETGFVSGEIDLPEVGEIMTVDRIVGRSVYVKEYPNIPIEITFFELVPQLEPSILKQADESVKSDSGETNLGWRGLVKLEEEKKEKEEQQKRFENSVESLKKYINRTPFPEDVKTAYIDKIQKLVISTMASGKFQDAVGDLFTINAELDSLTEKIKQPDKNKEEKKVREPKSEIDPEALDLIEEVDMMFGLVDGILKQKPELKGDLALVKLTNQLLNYQQRLNILDLYVKEEYDKAKDFLSQMKQTEDAKLVAIDKTLSELLGYERGLLSYKEQHKLPSQSVRQTERNLIDLMTDGIREIRDILRLSYMKGIQISELTPKVQELAGEIEEKVVPGALKSLEEAKKEEEKDIEKFRQEEYKLVFGDDPVKAKRDMDQWKAEGGTIGAIFKFKIELARQFKELKQRHKLNAISDRDEAIYRFLIEQKGKQQYITGGPLSELTLEATEEKQKEKEELLATLANKEKLEAKAAEASRDFYPGLSRIEELEENLKEVQAEKVSDENKQLINSLKTNLRNEKEKNRANRILVAINTLSTLFEDLKWWIENSYQKLPKGERRMSVQEANKAARGLVERTLEVLKELPYPKGTFDSFYSNFATKLGKYLVPVKIEGGGADTYFYTSSIHDIMWHVFNLIQSLAGNALPGDVLSDFREKWENELTKKWNEIGPQQQKVAFDVLAPNPTAGDPLSAMPAELAKKVPETNVTKEVLGAPAPGRLQNEEALKTLAAQFKESIFVDSASTFGPAMLEEADSDEKERFFSNAFKKFCERNKLDENEIKFLATYLVDHEKMDIAILKKADGVIKYWLEKSPLEETYSVYRSEGSEKSLVRKGLSLEAANQLVSHTSLPYVERYENFSNEVRLPEGIDGRDGGGNRNEGNVFVTPKRTV